MKWETAVTRILREAGQPLSRDDIVQRIAEQKLRNMGANPSGSVAAVLSSLANDDSSEVMRVSRGFYQATSTAAASVCAQKKTTLSLDSEEEESENGGFIQCFGIAWRRGDVQWRGGLRLLGKQDKAATEVNFSNQMGVYILHDRSRAIYVGRAKEKRLGARLFEHTRDRLANRWDCFSWLGILTVKDDGEFGSVPNVCTDEMLTATLEGILIETVEPPLNRRRGDGLAEFEYLQVRDPEIERREEEAVLERLRARTFSAR